MSRALLLVHNRDSRPFRLPRSVYSGDLVGLVGAL